MRKIHANGKEFERLYLHGGGVPYLGVYATLLRSLALDPWKMDVRLTCSSAGAGAFLFLLCLKHADEAALRSEIARIQASLLDISWLDIDLDQEFIVGDLSKHIEPLVPEEVRRLTFADLRKANESFDVEVAASTIDCGHQLVSVSFSADKTPQVPVWLACVASMSIPVLFKNLEIGGVKCFDGDFTRCCAENDPSVLHLWSRQSAVETLSAVRVPLLRSILVTLVSLVFKSVAACENGSIDCRVSPSMEASADAFAPEYVREGQRLARMIVLK